MILLSNARNTGRKTKDNKFRFKRTEFEKLLPLCPQGHFRQESVLRRGRLPQGEVGRMACVLRTKQRDFPERGSRLINKTPEPRLALIRPSRHTPLAHGFCNGLCFHFFAII